MPGSTARGLRRLAGSISRVDNAAGQYNQGLSALDVLTGQGVAGADEAGPGACVPWRGPWPGGGVRAER
ncbi:hypothetical protein ACE1SV_56300 [Streptomyces sp. E-15]